MEEKILYTAVMEDSCTKTYKDKEKNEWHYIPAKDMEMLRDIKGDIGRKVKSDEDVSIALLFSNQPEKSLKVYPVASRLKKTEKIAGYLPCTDADGNSVYLRVIKKRYIWFLLPLFLMLGLIGGIVGWQFLQNRPHLDDQAIAYQMPGGLVNEDPEKIMIPGFGKIEMNAETGEVNALLPNPEGNPCYFTYIISLEGNGEELYRSGLLEPGTAIKGFTIQKQLDPGEYEIEIQVKTGQLSDPKKPMNDGIIKAKLEVK